MPRRFKRDEEEKKEAIYFSSEDIKQIRKLLENFPSRIKMLEHFGVIKLYEDSNFSALASSDFLGASTHVGSHTYNSEVPYAFWIEAFSALDDYSSRELYFENKRVFEMTGEWPKNHFFEKIKGQMAEFIKTKSQ